MKPELEQCWEKNCCLKYCKPIQSCFKPDTDKKLDKFKAKAIEE